MDCIVHGVTTVGHNGMTFTLFQEGGKFQPGLKRMARLFWGKWNDGCVYVCVFSEQKLEARKMEKTTINQLI